MAELKGTNLAAGIVPFTDKDTFPTHYSQYGKGGYRTVQTLEERDSISEERKEIGMLCYVIEDPNGTHTYKLNHVYRWEPVEINASGIPIYDQEEIDKLGDDVKEKHIFIPSESDLNGEIENKTYTTSGNGSYLDILFSSIRQLQSEVAKLRNSFKYGIYSYTGTETAMSSAIGSIEEPDDEPLWAVEPDMLSLITGADVMISSDVQNLEPKDKVNPVDNKLVLLGEVRWTDRDDLVKNTEDSKLFMYLTVSHLNIKLFLDSTIDNYSQEIDLTGLGDNLVHLEKYQVLLVLSRKTNKGGKNYLWVSIGNPDTGITLKEGYFDPNTGNLRSGIIELLKSFTVRNIILTDLDLYQLDFYSKYQEFTQDVMPSKPNDQDYKYRVAHLTIRSVRGLNELESIKDQLPNNELVFEEYSKKLYIKSNDDIIAILGGSGGNSNNGSMSDQELIEKLKELGIIYEDENNSLQLSSISDITFVHQATGKQFKFEVDSEGSLVSSELPDLEKLLSTRIENLKETSFAIDESNQFRGFVAKLHCSEDNVNPVNTKDVKLNSDRIKIGSVYLPLESDTVFGCSHAFVELENTSDVDFPLNGCYLHFLCQNENKNTIIKHLALEGILPSGSTFLVRGKKYSDPSINSSTFINVDTYDMEWYDNGELIDFTIKYNGVDNDGVAVPLPYGFALTYGQSNLGVDSILRFKNEDPSTSEKATSIYPWYYIDSLPINIHTNSTDKPWGQNVVVAKPNSIIKNMFELDPAKQAFQALTTYDSSRERLAKIDNDVQVLRLDKPFISFPHSEEEYPISRFAPKSSKCKKNVGTDKTKFNQEKPNAVTCAFGIDIYKTRCFNWVSAGEFDEYVWIKKEGEEIWNKFESYKTGKTTITQGTTFPRRKEFSVDINNTVYARLSGNFPGCNIHYTSHKCIVDVISESPTQPVKYQYVVGREDKLGNPDIQHCSDIYTFILYPETYTPRVYQTTDQQGFHWIEYQVWSAAAKYLNEKIKSDQEKENIIPILLNTGDMTQNGTRVNEWLDYFNGGQELFNHLEHMAVVGNNDLCGPNPEVLGTGDDSGKSNSYYFHVFFCYEIFQMTSDSYENIVPIVNGKYIPSLYYFDTKDYRFLMANSEITYATCKTWYGLDASESNKDRVFNIYTGHGVPNSNDDNWTSNNFNDSFVSVYTMMWNILNNLGDKKPIIACHEMPFTVITTECIAMSTKDKSRSVSGSSLVGCHMNQLTPTDTNSQYWFSRLCEFFKVKLVLGGHKHTYAATLPVREFYFYDKTEDGTFLKNSRDNGPMDMPETLKNDVISWYSDGKHLSKFPLLYNYSENTTHPNNDENYFWPFTNDPTDDYKDNRVIYFMCQATGYKQTSNKELPTNYQSFSSLIPKSKITMDGSVVTKSTADNQQKYPMYLVIKFNESDWELSLSRVCNILDSDYKFTQSNYSSDNMKEQFAIMADSTSKYCYWINSEDAVEVNVGDVSEITGAKANTLYKLDNKYYLCHKAEDTEKNTPAAFFEISSTETLIKIDL